MQPIDVAMRAMYDDTITVAGRDIIDKVTDLSKAWSRYEDDYAIGLKLLIVINAARALRIALDTQHVELLKQKIERMEIDEANRA